MNNNDFGPDPYQEATKHYCTVIMQEELTKDQAFLLNLEAQEARQKIIAKATALAKHEFKNEYLRRQNAQNLAVRIELEYLALIDTLKATMKEHFPDRYEEVMDKARARYEKKREEFFQDRDLIDKTHAKFDRVIYNLKYVFPQRGRTPLEAKKAREMLTKRGVSSQSR